MLFTLPCLDHYFTVAIHPAMLINCFTCFENAAPHPLHRRKMAVLHPANCLTRTYHMRCMRVQAFTCTYYILHARVQAFTCTYYTLHARVQAFTCSYYTLHARVQPFHFIYYMEAMRLQADRSVIFCSTVAPRIQSASQTMLTMPQFRPVRP